MRLLFVVHRYGREVLGGAEGACRELATRLAARGHDVTVVTTRALRYREWDLHYEGGEETLDGVTVVRLDNRPRDVDGFERLNGRVAAAEEPIAPALQEAWIDAQGPNVPELADWLTRHGPDHDVCLFMPYLYGTTTTGLPAIAGRVPVVLVPCLHPEPPLRLRAFDELADLADLVVFLTPEEAELFHTRFRPHVPSVVAGLGVEAATDRADAEEWRRRTGIGSDPYVLYLGRIDPSKGTDWLVEHFVEHKTRVGGPLRLLMAGDVVVQPPTDDDVVLAGPVDDATRAAMLEDAVALVHPSPYESFSLVLMEAWSAATAALVYGGNPVLRGHVERSRGGLVFDDGAELSVALAMLVESPPLRDRLGRAGQRHVDEHYRWERVLDRWEQAARRATATRRIDAR